MALVNSLAAARWCPLAATATGSRVSRCRLTRCRGRGSAGADSTNNNNNINDEGADEAPPRRPTSREDHRMLRDLRARESHIRVVKLQRSRVKVGDYVSTEAGLDV
jgi:hypothetical protein